MEALAIPSNEVNWEQFAEEVEEVCEALVRESRIQTLAQMHEEVDLRWREVQGLAETGLTRPEREAWTGLWRWSHGIQSAGLQPLQEGHPLQMKTICEMQKNMRYLLQHIEEVETWGLTPCETSLKHDLQVWIQELKTL